MCMCDVNDYPILCSFKTSPLNKHLSLYTLSYDTGTGGPDCGGRTPTEGGPQLLPVTPNLVIFSQLCLRSVQLFQ